MTSEVTFDVEILDGRYRVALNGPSDGLALEASDIFLDRGSIRAIITARRGESLVHRDQLVLSRASARDGFSKSLLAKGEPDGAGDALVALDQAIRENPPDTTDGPQADALELLKRGETVRPLHAGQDVVDGVLWYGVPVAGKLTLINSTRMVYEASVLPRTLALRHTDLKTSTISRDIALRWLSGGEAGSVADALDTLSAFFRRYLVFRHAETVLLLAAWALATWIFRGFRVFPYLSVRSPEKQCGKTRLLNLLARVTFNASPVTAHPTEAQLYRTAWQTSGTQLFDEMESLRGDKERFDALISVLNCGFERGGVVARLEKRGDKFVDVGYEVYAPRALAGIASLKETLADRSIPIFMMRKRRDESVARFTAAVEPEAEALRAACALACLTHIRDVLAASDQAPGLLERERVDDRAVDLWGPLVALTLVADAEDAGDRTARLLALTRELAGLRDADADEGQTTRLVAALDAIRTERGDELVPGDLLAALQVRPGWGWVKSTKRLSGLLQLLGLFPARRRGSDGRPGPRTYSLKAATLADLRARFGAPDISVGEGPE